MSERIQVTLRKENPPDETVIMVRAGQNSLDEAKLQSDAGKSLLILGVLGISVQSSLPGEGLEDAWRNSRVLSARDVIWWSTAGRLREAGFPLLPTGTDPRHYTVVLAHRGPELLAHLASQFQKEDR